MQEQALQGDEAESFPEPRTFTEVGPSSLCRQLFLGVHKSLADYQSFTRFIILQGTLFAACRA
jgi:hypothetical protein